MSSDSVFKVTLGTLANMANASIKKLVFYGFQFSVFVADGATKKSFFEEISAESIE